MHVICRCVNELLCGIEGTTDVDERADFDKLSPRARPRLNSLSRYPASKTVSPLALPQLQDVRASSMHDVHAGVTQDMARSASVRNSHLLFADTPTARSSFHCLPTRTVAGEVTSRERSAVGEKKSRSFRSSRPKANTVDSTTVNAHDITGGETAFTRIQSAASIHLQL